MATMRQIKALHNKEREMAIVNSAHMVGVELVERLSQDRNLDAQKISSLITAAIAQLVQLQNKIVTLQLQEGKIIDAENWWPNVQL